MPPLVSICIPTFNGALYIEEALESVINQTYNQLEVIVSDDASTDTTLDIIERYKTKTNIPIHIYHHQPKGIGANWNHCIKQAKGDYIKFLFQDDVLLPTCVEEMVNSLESHPNTMMVASKRKTIYDTEYRPDLVADWNERFGDLQKRLDLAYTNDICILDYQFFKHKEFYRSPLNKIGEPTTVMFRKSLIESVGNFREDLKQILDYEFYYRVLKNHSIAILNKPLVKFRLHENQATNLNKIDSVKNDDESYSYILYKEYLELVDPYVKKHLIKKHHPIFKVLYRIKGKLLKLFR